MAAVFTRFILCVVVSFLCVLAGAENLLLTNNQLVEGVVVRQRHTDGTIDVEFGGLLQTFRREQYRVLTPRDVMVLRDGRFFVGRIGEETAEAVTLVEENGAMQTHRRADVLRLAWGVHETPGAASTASAAPTVEQELARASVALDGRSYNEAGIILRDVARMGIERNTEAIRLFTRLMEGVAGDAERLRTAQREEEAVTLVAPILEVLQDPAMANAFSPMIIEANIETLLRLQAQASIAYGQRIIEQNQASRYPNAASAFDLAERSFPTFDGALGMAEVLARMGQLDDARPWLERAAAAIEPTAQGSPEALSALRTRFYRVQGRWEASGREVGRPMEPVLRPAATPTPPSTPAMMAAPPPILPPDPATLPPPPAEPLTPLQQYVLTPYQMADEWTRANAGMPAWGLLAAVVGTWLVLWVAPQMLVERMRRRGSADAANWYGTVKWLGVLGLLLMLLAMAYDRLIASRRKPREKPLDHNIDSLPVYEVEDYINRLIRKLEETSMNEGGLGQSLENNMMQKLIRAMVTLGIKRRASDIHIEPEMDGANVRMRLDGVLYDMVNVPRAISAALISGIKVMANLDISQKRLAQDGKISMWVDNTDVDVRVNTAPGPIAERVTMRLLDSRSIRVDSNRLGLEGAQLDLFETLIRRPSGVIYLTGPTGSGKTTTLYVALNTLNTGEKNIITIEDPIEYQLKGISQMQVNDSAGFSFAKGLRSILRSDPDIIMVGEIRDKETADIAIDAASTGHLVFTTVHTIDAPTVLTRLLDLGVEPRRAASSMLAAIAQRLIRVNCPACKKAYTPAPALLDQLGLIASDREDITFMKGTGCEACQQTGFQGRLGLFEVLAPDEALREMMESGAPINAIRDMARRKGMRTLREEGIERIRQGLTTVEEVLRCT